MLPPFPAVRLLRCWASAVPSFERPGFRRAVSPKTSHRRLFSDRQDHFRCATTPAGHRRTLSPKGDTAEHKGRQGGRTAGRGQGAGGSTQRAGGSRRRTGNGRTTGSGQAAENATRSTRGAERHGRRGRALCPRANGRRQRAANASICRVVDWSISPDPTKIVLPPNRHRRGPRPPDCESRAESRGFLCGAVACIRVMPCVTLIALALLGVMAVHDARFGARKTDQEQQRVGRRFASRPKSFLK
jgi:hypothetical protein